MYLDEVSVQMVRKDALAQFEGPLQYSSHNAKIYWSNVSTKLFAT